ncbi:DUF58 domain-containing protein [Flavitalea sp. BT771]|uniref:DUF58 domain-containing protein n=1 Tax=Flavitalea sp. BT771 TaxID=3063329 RepID=UPI0026E42C20|nr:DUF58 domain-containing protein [Flavitalea sp. BT771]MDO6434973.1 DUF58 domain-containing protein [Flavitalea sp. BT771]MDV6223873.1 DUF58 domain-containing protein [Flavitalea sp. BT771]
MSELQDHHILMAIKDLSLAARRTIDGFMAGINKSKVKGPGLEFSQYRSYQPGDDLRWLDWKRYARSDRYYIRESEIETSISIRLLVDASSSMAHRDGAFAKLDYARLLAASLGWLAHMQGDSFGLYVFQEGDVFSLPSRKDPQHLARFFYQLENIRPGGRMGEPTQYKHIFTGDQKRELLVFFTDMYERDGEISGLLEVLAALRHEIIVFHLMGKNELEMDYKGYHRVQDLETREQIPFNDLLAPAAYKERLQAWLAGVRMQLLDKQIAYSMVRMDQSPGDALRDFLKQRQKTIG